MKEKTFKIVAEVFEDSVRCTVPECKVILREHAFGILQLAVDLGICNVYDINEFSRKYPKA